MLITFSLKLFTTLVALATPSPSCLSHPSSLSFSLSFVDHLPSVSPSNVTVTRDAALGPLPPLSLWGPYSFLGKNYPLTSVPASAPPVKTLPGLGSSWAPPGCTPQPQTALPETKPIVIHLKLAPILCFPSHVSLPPTIYGGSHPKHTGITLSSTLTFILTANNQHAFLS